MAMARMAYTELSRPDEVPDSTTVAGPVSEASAISCTGAVLGAGEVLGEPADHLGQDEADEHGGEALPARVGVVVADVDQREQQRADHGEDAGGEEAPVDGVEGVGLAGAGPHREDAGDRGQHADGPHAEREDEPEGRVGADGVEGGDAEDDRGHQGDLVALEEVGGHAGAVADVVAHVVGDGGRVAGVVLRDAGLDLADQVGADVGGLGEDAAAHPQEQGQQRAAEAEPDQDGRGGVLEDHDDDRRPEQAEADREHARRRRRCGRPRRARRGIEPSLAAAAVRTLPRVASVMPM